MQVSVLLKNKNITSFFFAFLFSEQFLNQDFGRKETAEKYVQVWKLYCQQQWQ